MKNLTQGNIYKNFFIFAFPLVLSGVLTQSYATINTVIAGQYLGDTGLAAIGTTAPFVSFLNSVFWGFANGIGVYISNLYGAGKFYRLKNVVINNGLFLLSFITLICGLILLFKSNIYSFLQIDSAVLKYSNIYFSILTLGKSILIFNTFFVYIFNALGDSAFPFCLSIISAVLNIAGNILLVAVFKIGIAGLAVSTVFSALVVDICYILKLPCYFKRMNVDKHKTIFNFKYVKSTMQFSIFTMLQQSVMYFSSMILSPIVNGLGSAASASYTVTLRVYDVNSAIYQHSARTIGNFIGQCNGGKKYHLIKKGLWVGILQNILFVLPILLLCFIFPEQVCKIFFESSATGQAFEYSVVFVKFYLPFIFFNILANALHHFLRGMGEMKALLITGISGCLSRIMFSLLLVPYLGIHGIYVGWVMFWIGDAALGFMFYRFGKWRKDIKI